jgi:hypothetical protein
VARSSWSLPGIAGDVIIIMGRPGLPAATAETPALPAPKRNTRVEVANLLWLYTEPGEIVVDPFAGGGTTVDAAKAMSRRVWASDTVRTGWRSAGKRYGRYGLSAS